MPYNPAIASAFLSSVRGCLAALAEEDENKGKGKSKYADLDVSAKRMMGGECVMVGGNMVGGVCSLAKGGDIILRVGKEQYEDALTNSVLRKCNFTGRPMKGFVTADVTALGLRGLNDPEDATAKQLQQLDGLVMMAVDFAASLPPKSGSKPRKRPAAAAPKAKKSKASEKPTKPSPKPKSRRAANSKAKQSEANEKPTKPPPKPKSRHSANLKAPKRAAKSRRSTRTRKSTA
eukprot:INCI8814.1.p1 GENE.INCI8814.1~~INCI8814.1.p1  ORF type:complete len:233 (+),score=47.72 INCI8814.1:324-1022(+)